MLCELLRRRQASGALIPQEDHHRCELRELQIKLGLRELQHHELLCEIRDLRCATGGSRMRINLGLASPNSPTRKKLYSQLLDRV